MPLDGRWLPSVALSVAGHAVVLVATGAAIVDRAGHAAPAAVASAARSTLQLSGDTFEIDTVDAEEPNDLAPPASEGGLAHGAPKAPAPPPVASIRPTEAVGRSAAAQPSGHSPKPPRPPAPSSAVPWAQPAEHALADPPRSHAAKPPNPGSQPAVVDPVSARRTGSKKAPPVRNSKSQPTPSGAAAYGAAVERGGRLLLAPFFTRAIPAAVSADPVWSKLSVGSAGGVDVTIVLDERGAVELTSVPPGTAAHLASLVVRTTALLRAGRFALTRVDGAGRETLRVDVTLSQHPPLESVRARAVETLELGYDPPTEARPGRAYFKLASGRHFEARVRIVRSESSPSVATTAAKLDAGVMDAADAD